MPVSSSRLVLYRFFDQHNSLLYIGKSYSAMLRIEQHRWSSPFWSEVVTIKLQRGWWTAKELDDAERIAIAIEHPRYNVVGNGNERLKSRVKLRPGDVAVIRASAEPNSVLAARFGVHPQTIYAVRSRRSWRDVP